MTQIGPYTVVGKLGEGGMGQVYRARDSRLGRDVAIKVLPPALANDADYLARFQREAQVLASLNHPNIAAIYGLEDNAIVMELVEGSELRGPLPIDEAIRIAKQIADGLEAAHERGIIHRDLKPANIRITADGTVKILDFGLAKAQEPAATATASAANSPTLTIHATTAGMILGTAAYMSPEQAAGKAVDRRADIWAFGVVLWELITGRQLFAGETISHTLASVLKDEIDLTPIPDGSARRLIARCLDRNPKTRLGWIGEARAILDGPAVAVAPPPTRGRLWLPWAVAALAVLGLSGTVLWQRTRPVSVEEPVAFSLSGNWNVISDRQGFMAVSPDGRKLAIAASGDGVRGVWIRELGQAEARLLAKVEGAYGLFWAPDNSAVGFATADKLQVAELRTGAVTTLASNITANFRGGTWNQHGDILYAPRNMGGLWLVRSGEQPREVLPASDKEWRSLTWPWFLPNGRDFLLIAASENEAVLAAGSIGSTKLKVIMKHPQSTRYAAGYLVFAAQGALVAQPFDPDRMQLSGKPTQLAASVGSRIRYVMFGVGGDTLVWAPPGAVGADQSTGSWADLKGTRQPFRGAVSHPEVSPDGKSVAYCRDRDLWVYDLRSSREMRLTFDPRNDWIPAWSADSKTVFWVGSAIPVGPQIFRKRADGAGQEEQLTTVGNRKHHMHIAPDSKTAVLECNSDAAPDLCAFDVTTRKISTLLESPASEIHPQISPDGKWLAYASDASGRFEVYVRGFPSLSGPWQVSTDGGVQPRWRGDGKSLYYLDSSAWISAVPVEANGEAFRVGARERILATRTDPMLSTSHFAMAPDGKHFLVLDAPSAGNLNVIVNWQRLVAP